jgi:hypothetical protein
LGSLSRDGSSARPVVSRRLSRPTLS